MAGIMSFQKLAILASEVERQSAIVLNSSQKTSSSLNTNVGKLVLEAEEYRHYLDLKDWCQTLGRADGAVWDHISIPATCQGHLWKFLAFSNSSLPILNLESQLARYRNLQEVRERSNPSNSSTDDIWQAAALRSWATRTESCVAIIQGNSQTVRCLEQFTYEISNQLRDMHPTLLMLNEPSTREFLAGHEEIELLRQIAIQVLGKISHFKASFLLECVYLFKKCTSSHDWFHMLKFTFQALPKLYMIVDLNTLGARRDRARNWPEDFQNIVSQLNSRCSSQISIMLLSSRPLFCQNPNISIISVASQSRQSSHSLSPNRPLKKPSTPIRCFKTLFLADTKDGAVEGLPIVNGLILDAPVSGQRSDSIHSPVYLGRPLNEIINKPFDHMFAGANQYPLPHRNDIAIVVICALPLEANAVLAMFDQHCSMQSFSNIEGDKNAYSVGRIGCHNVVLAHMPGMGRAAAATVTTSCRTSFPGLRLALLVGICGAVPYYHCSTEILLGDVIISDRLIIYDFGRQFPDQFMRKIEAQEKQPQEVRNFLSKMKTSMHRSKLQVRTGFHLNALLGSGYPRYPGTKEDRLFEPTYIHQHQTPTECLQCVSTDPVNGSVCKIARISMCDALGCDPTKLVIRQRHFHIMSGAKSWLPVIHFGAYASGDTVMKSGEHRDQIASREEVIAFEMEGAGVWDILPCIIIKGVCDYADSHKNKNWQEYVAGTAAACLKAFLEVWPAANPTQN